MCPPGERREDTIVHGWSQSRVAVMSTPPQSLHTATRSSAIGHYNVWRDESQEVSVPAMLAPPKPWSRNMVLLRLMMMNHDEWYSKHAVVNLLNVCILFYFQAFIIFQRHMSKKCRELPQCSWRIQIVWWCMGPYDLEACMYCRYLDLTCCQHFITVRHGYPDGTNPESWISIQPKQKMEILQF